MTEHAAQFEVDPQHGETAVQALMRESGLGEALILDAAAKGAVWVSRQRGRGKSRPQRLRLPTSAVAQGSTLMLNYNAQVLASAALPMSQVSDHVNYSIWFKPSGMLCQGSKWSDHTVATQVAASICNRHCFLVHRLDKAACGLMVIAHTKNSLTKLTALFEQRRVQKTYTAVVPGKFDPELPLHINQAIDDRQALTTVHSVNYDNERQCTTITLSIETGRKHQIRKHLAAQGFSIMGDRLYGAQGVPHQDSINLQLVSCALAFECPFTGEAITTSIDASKALAEQAYS